MPMSVTYTTINGEVIAENRGGVRKQYIPDPLGNTVAMIDSTQTITDTFSYWPYGELSEHTGTSATGLKFVGTLGYYSDTPNTIYVRARYLFLAAGRWLTLDPLQTGINWFGYANMAPTVIVDPSGLAPASCSDCVLDLVITGVSPYGACMRCNHGVKCANQSTKPLSPAQIAALKAIFGTTSTDPTDLCQQLTELRGSIIGLIGATGGDVPSYFFLCCTESCTNALGASDDMNFTKCNKLAGFKACLKTNPNAPSSWLDWLKLISDLLQATNGI